MTTAKERTVKFIQVLHSANPGLVKYLNSVCGENVSGNVLIFMGDGKDPKGRIPIILLTSGCFCTKTQREIICSTLKEKPTSDQYAIYLLSAYDVAFVCNQEAQTKIEMEASLNGCYVLQWKVEGNPVTLDDDGHFETNFFSIFTQSLVNYVTWVIECVSLEDPFQYYRSHAEEIGIMQEGFIMKQLENFYNKTGETDKKILDMLLGLKRYKIKKHKDGEPELLLYSEEEKKFLAANWDDFFDKEQDFLDFVQMSSYLRGTPVHLPVVGDVEVGSRVLNYLESRDSQDNQEELEVMLAFAFFSNESNFDHEDQSINAGWLKVAFHTEVVYSVLKKKKSKIREEFRYLLPGEDDNLLSLLDPCKSCSRIELTLKCMTGNVIFLFVRVDKNGNKFEKDSMYFFGLDDEGIIQPKEAEEINFKEPRNGKITIDMKRQQMMKKMQEMQNEAGEAYKANYLLVLSWKGQRKE